MADAVSDAYDRGNDAYRDGHVLEALAAWEEAAARATPAHDDWAGDLYENLGIAYWRLGRWAPAARAFLRALDGGAAREQSLRLLVSCLFRAQHWLDGPRWLRAYEAAFGPHPEGWTPSPST